MPKRMTREEFAARLVDCIPLLAPFGHPAKDRDNDPPEIVYISQQGGAIGVELANGQIFTILVKQP